MASGFRLLGRCIGRMSYREVSVIEIREMLRLWLQGLGLREVARLSGTYCKTVRRCGPGPRVWTGPRRWRLPADR